VGELGGGSGAFEQGLQERGADGVGQGRGDGGDLVRGDVRELRGAAVDVPGGALFAQADGADDPNRAGAFAITGDLAELFEQRQV